jgi:hypothetical protein
MNENTAYRLEETQSEGDYAPQPVFPLDQIGERIQRVHGEEHTRWSVREDEVNTTANGHNRTRSISHILIPSPRFEPKGNFRTLQKYECVVLSIGTDSFWAKLMDLTTPEHEDEQGEFLMDDVSDSDRPLVKTGAVFYWHIGYYDSPDGQRTRQSSILFRRLPAITEDRLNEAGRKAKEFLEAFNRTAEKNCIDDE